MFYQESAGATPPIFFSHSPQCSHHYWHMLPSLGTATSTATAFLMTSLLGVTSCIYVSRTKDMIIEFRMLQPSVTHTVIQEKDIEIVCHYKYLCPHVLHRGLVWQSSIGRKKQASNAGQSGKYSDQGAASLQDIYCRCVTCKAQQILNCPNHPLFKEFGLYPLAAVSECPEQNQSMPGILFSPWPLRS